MTLEDGGGRGKAPLWIAFFSFICLVVPHRVAWQLQLWTPTSHGSHFSCMSMDFAWARMRVQDSEQRMGPKSKLTEGVAHTLLGGWNWQVSSKYGGLVVDPPFFRWGPQLTPPLPRLSTTTTSTNLPNHTWETLRTCLGSTPGPTWTFAFQFACLHGGLKKKKKLIYLNNYKFGYVQQYGFVTEKSPRSTPMNCTWEV